jgi:outer membrane lipoprotein-sorting protein
MSMKRFALCAVVAGGVAAAAFAFAPKRAGQDAAVPALTADQIVEKNAVARGGREAWRKIDTMAWIGRVETASRGGRKAPFLLEQKRPDRTRFEVTVDGLKSVRIFDGSNGWKARPSRSGLPDVQPYSADELRFARAAPVIEGPLMDYAAKGATIAVTGVHELQGRKAYALSLRLASGTSYRVWIDAETFLELRYDREFVNAQGRPAVTSVRFADYRAVDGLQLPFTIETGAPDGKAGDRLQIERVVLNPHLEDRTFAKPGSAVARRRGVSVDTRSAAQGTPALPAR